MDKKDSVKNKIQDTIIPIGDKYCLNLFDTTEVKVSKSSIDDGRILYFTKINAFEEKQNSVFNTNRNKVSEDTDYVAFEMMPLLKKHLLKNPELQKKFMSYVALYFLNEKKENRDEKYHFIGLMSPADDEHYINSIRKKDKEYFKENLERIVKAHSNEVEK